MNIYYLSGQNYLETLRYIQEKCIGPLGTSPFTISTIGGTLTQDTPQQRDTNDFISDTRRQVGVRRSLY